MYPGWCMGGYPVSCLDGYILGWHQMAFGQVVLKQWALAPTLGCTNVNWINRAKATSPGTTRPRPETRDPRHLRSGTEI